MALAASSPVFGSARSLMARRGAHMLAKAAWGVATLSLTFGLGLSEVALARESSKQIEDVPLSALPTEAQRTEQLIRAGGPFPYDKDGVVFGNRERLLPREKRGYYREYTVRTPGSRDRGARRIVCGGEQVRAPEACFYTDDHYASFRRIVK